MSEENLDLPWTDPIEDEEMALRVRAEERAAFMLPIPAGLIDRLSGGRISVGAFVAYAEGIAAGGIEGTAENEAIILELLASSMLVEHLDGFQILPPSFWS